MIVGILKSWEKKYIKHQTFAWRVVYCYIVLQLHPYKIDKDRLIDRWTDRITFLNLNISLYQRKDKDQLFKNSHLKLNKFV